MAIASIYKYNLPIKKKNQKHHLKQVSQSILKQLVHALQNEMLDRPRNLSREI